MVRVDNQSGVQTASLRETLKQIPAVVAVAAATTVPFLGWGPLQSVAEVEDGQGVRAERGSIGPGFFATLDVPMRAGRTFVDEDFAVGRTAIVNETLASRLFPGADPLGREIWIGGMSYAIVGLVADYKNTALQNHDWDPKVFLPLDPRVLERQQAFLIRTAGDPAAVERAARRAVPAAAAGNRVASSITLDRIIDISGQEILVGTAPLAPLVATGMLLTAAGIYGVLAFAIARRSRELAVRVAIGAGRRTLVKLVAARSLRLVMIGAGCGVAATFGLSRVVRAAGAVGSFLDPAWTSFPVLIVLCIGAVATWVPSRRP